jgi:hypothetical protein
MSFLGNEGIEFLFGNNTVLVKIGSLDHFLKDIIVSEFTEILGDLSEILEGDEACVISKSTSLLCVKSDEDFVNFVSGLVVRRTSGHHIKELRELNLSAAILIELSDHLIDSLGLGFDTEGVDGNFEF